MEIASAFVTVALLVYYSYCLRSGEVMLIPALWLAAAFHLKRTVEEVDQILKNVAEQVVSCLSDGKAPSSEPEITAQDFDIVYDFVYVTVGWLAIVWQLQWREHELAKPFLSMFSGTVWLRLLYVLRGESWLGPRLLPIQAALVDTGAFFFLTLLCAVAATHAYYNLGIR